MTPNFCQPFYFFTIPSLHVGEIFAVQSALHKDISFQKAYSNNLKSKVLNFTQEFLNSNPINNSMDTNWEIIQRNLYTIIDTAVPWKLSHRKRQLPWISLRIKCSMQKRDKLYCRARKYQDAVHWDNFCQCRNKVAKW